MAGHTLVIVESATKAKKIQGFLGSGYKVLASVGHVRDLPGKAAEVPKAVKGEPWATLGVNTEKDFEPLYIVPADKKKRVTELKAALKGAKELLIATDEDREGESIGWHLLQLLKPKCPVKRMVFSEITAAAIKKAVANPRQLDTDLVEAQETRRILDRLYGYTLSPLLWKKISSGLSPPAGCSRWPCGCWSSARWSAPPSAAPSTGTSTPGWRRGPTPRPTKRSPSKVRPDEGRRQERSPRAGTSTSRPAGSSPGPTSPTSTRTRRCA